MYFALVSKSPWDSRNISCYIALALVQTLFYEQCSSCASWHVTTLFWTQSILYTAQRFIKHHTNCCCLALPPEWDCYSIQPGEPHFMSFFLLLQTKALMSFEALIWKNLILHFLSGFLPDFHRKIHLAWLRKWKPVHGTYSVSIELCIWASSSWLETLMLYLPLKKQWSYSAKYIGEATLVLVCSFCMKKNCCTPRQVFSWTLQGGSFGTAIIGTRWSVKSLVKLDSNSYSIQTFLCTAEVWPGTFSSFHGTVRSCTGF